MNTDTDIDLDSESRTSLIALLRVELRPPDGGTEILAQLAAFAQHATLDPFVAWLLHHRRSGQLVLVEEATGAIVANRWVGPSFPTHRRRLASRPRHRKQGQGATLVA